MELTRRDVLASIAAAGAGQAAVRPVSTSAARGVADPFGVLVDLTACIGCRKCEWACNQANHLPAATVAAFEDTSVFGALRRPDASHYTVVNRSPGAGEDDRPVFVKVQCMHCDDPACCSACIVSALEKQADGAVTYSPWRCMGCRYCMVVCPFQIPAYEYLNPTTPQVRKCTFCHERISRQGMRPACVEICPPQCLTFGRRSELLALAHRQIAGGSGRYAPHVYGEHEVGGTSWLYLSSVPFSELGFPALGDKAPPRLTESLQHGVFKDFIPPLALFGALAVIARLFRPDGEEPPSGEGRRP